jgi:outer membrane protein TolC
MLSAALQQIRKHRREDGKLLATRGRSDVKQRPSARPSAVRTRLLRHLPRFLLVLAFGCTTADYRDDADRQVYDILRTASAEVTGKAKELHIERPADTLRQRLLADPAQQRTLDLQSALDAAAENSREFQDRRERLYRVALNLTLEQHQFALRFSDTVSGDVSGVGDDEASASLRNSLFASRNTESGGTVVASFVTTFLKDLLHGGSFNGSSLLGLSLTQPLLRGFGARIAREPLTQAERDVIYEMRAFERFRSTFAVDVVSDYYRVLEELDNLASETSNVEGTRRNRERVEALVNAGRLAGVDLDRAKQEEFDANDRLNIARAAYEARRDAFRVSLGLPTDARIEVDPTELARLREQSILDISLPEHQAIAIALGRRLDYRTTVDDVEDAGRRVMVAEDALRSVLDFSAAVAVPTEPGKPGRFDWSKVQWSAGFDLDLALDRLPERNTYRSTLIDLDATMRAREAAEDRVKLEVRNSLRAISRTFTSYHIQSDALALSERRLQRADDFLQAGRGDTLALLDAQRDLLNARLSLTRAVVDYAIARLELLRDLEGLVLEPKGLRYDPGLPLPEGPLSGSGAGGEAE